MQIRNDTNAVEVARYESSQLDARITESEAKLKDAKRGEESSRRELSRYALQAYVSGGTDGDFASIVGTEGDKLGQRSGYVSAAVGDRQELVDRLQATQQVTAEQKKSLESDRAEAAAVQAEAEARQASAQQASVELQRIQSQLDGRMAELVAEQQAAEARAAEQRARAAAQAEAQAAAARTQARANAPVAPTVTVPAATPTPIEQPSTPEPSGNTGNTGGGNGGGAFVPPPNASAAGIAIAAAQSQLGVPYLWGGTAPGVGLDCSGLTQYAYSRAGISLPRVTYGQMGAGRVVPLSQIQPGDLVFYWSGGHVALYVGGGSVIHAPRTGDVVRYGSLYMGPPELVVRPTG